MRFARWILKVRSVYIVTGISDQTAVSSLKWKEGFFHILLQSLNPLINILSVYKSQSWLWMPGLHDGYNLGLFLRLQFCRSLLTVGNCALLPCRTILYPVRLRLAWTWQSAMPGQILVFFALVILLEYTRRSQSRPPSARNYNKNPDVARAQADITWIRLDLHESHYMWLFFEGGGGGADLKDLCDVTIRRAPQYYIRIVRKTEHKSC
jgi:hypothetical protein